MTTYYPLEPRSPGKSRLSLDSGAVLGGTERCLDRMAPLCMGDCDTELHFGLFFDGTNNNKNKDTASLTHTNVARLHDVFPIGKPENRRIYIAGVGTPFEQEIGDTGLGYQSRAGAGAGWGGEARINWALLQVQNELNSYLYGSGLTGAAADRALVKRMSADMSLPLAQIRKTGKSEVELLSQIDDFWGNALTIGHLGDTAVFPPNDAGRRQILQERCTQLRQKLGPVLAARKPRVRRIRLSVFGFSRGAAEARVFCHWLRDALDADMSLAGVPVEVNFLGLFDTVTSAGLAQSALISDGHQAWGRVRHLSVPDYVQRCVHMVSAHEIRGSFPLDLVSGGNCYELVYPGVHSDLGGGYKRGEQGRGCAIDTGAPEDSSKLSQIPLCDMFRFAIAEGVPLNLDAAGVTERMQAAFDISPALERSFNAYVEATDTMPGARDNTIAKFKLHYGVYLRWRRLRLGGGTQALAAQPFMQRALAVSRQDHADLTLANEELREEWQALLKDEGDGAYENTVTRRLLGAISPAMQVRDGFVRAVWGEKMFQWQQVKPFWEDTRPLDAAILTMFDDYAHDSRAWFKPTGAASEAVWKQKQRERLTQLEAQDKAHQEWMRKNGPIIEAARRRAQSGQMVAAPMLPPMPPPVHGQDRIDLDNWIRSDRKLLPLETEGREFSSLWGYLRWRTLYADGRSVWAPPTLYELASQKVQEAKRGIGDRLEDAYDYVGDKVDDAVDAGVDWLKDQAIDQAKKLLPIPNGIPPLR